MKACCMGCNLSPAAKPSTVRIFLPSACTANIKQERTGSPSTITVQAPQMPCSQPIWVPVCPQSSRMASTSVRRGSTPMTCSRPLMVRVMSVLSVIGNPCAVKSAVSCPRKQASSKRERLLWSNAVFFLGLGVYWVPAFAGTTAEIVSRSCGPFLCAQRRADALRRRRHLVDLDAKRGQRVVDGVGARCCQVMQLDRRDLARGRRQVIGKRRRQDAAALVVNDFLEQRIADALRDAAMHLTVGDHRIDDAAGVFGDDELLDLHMSGFDVDLD